MQNERPPTELVAGKYRLTRLLGRGGMGSVWEGVHATLGNRVACKFIEPEFVESQDALIRFENEARAAASLKSKHVVDVYDHGVMPDGRPYIVMEFLEGEPLDKRIEKLGVLTLAQTSIIILQVSRALSRAHRLGIVHRDLKPENVFLVWDDEDQTDVAKVVDFGIAKFTDREASGISSATKTGSILGTPYYMSPEQARGLKNLDARSDNWSLGVIAYEALTGCRPFDGEAVGDLLVKICTVDPVPPSQLNPNLPASVDDWMRRALHRDPHSRFQDVSEMSEALNTLAGAPGRGTLGSAVGLDETVAVAPIAGGKARTITQPQGSPKMTSGALTHANMGVDAAIAPPVNKTNPMIFVAAAVVVLGIAGGAIFMSGTDDAAESAEAAPEKGEDTPAAAAVQAPAPPAAPETRVPQPEPAAMAAPTPEPTPASNVAAPAPAPAAAPRPTPVARPRPQAPRPQAAPTPRPTPPPAPAPAPRPQPSGGFDLGY